jgi:hypothetical protein
MNEISINNFQTFLLQQNSVPEPDLQPSYSPVAVAQHGWTSESNREQDDDANNNDNEQLIENNDDDTPNQQEPFMRASKAVSNIKSTF